MASGLDHSGDPRKWLSLIFFPALWIYGGWFCSSSLCPTKVPKSTGPQSETPKTVSQSSPLSSSAHCLRGFCYS